VELCAAHNRAAAGVKGVDGPFAQRILGDGLPAGAVDSLLEAAAGGEAGGIFREYFEKKARMLGVPRLGMRDVYAEIPGSSPMGAAEAVDEVTATWRELSPELGAVAASIPASGHLHVIGAGGVGESCRPGLPGELPWIRLGLGGQPWDEFTLAAFMGMAVHVAIAGRKPRFGEIHPPEPLLKTSRALGKSLLGAWTQVPGDGEAARKAALCLWLDEICQHVIICGAVAAFEAEAHRMAAAGPVTGRDLAEKYLSALTGAVGAALEVPSGHRWTWLTCRELADAPFTMYHSAFGQLVALDLMRRRRLDGEAMARAVEGIFKAGGSATTAEILDAAGIGPLDAAYWSRCLGEAVRLIGTL
jgi:oligoendopeptidase F